ncbi:hypothetical protein HDU76_010632, partial [Blyttiomyces sp. JEL0837]
MGTAYDYNQQQHPYYNHPMAGYLPTPPLPPAQHFPPSHVAPPMNGYVPPPYANLAPPQPLQQPRQPSPSIPLMQSQSSPHSIPTLGLAPPVIIPTPSIGQLSQPPHTSQGCLQLPTQAATSLAPPQSYQHQPQSEQGHGQSDRIRARPVSMLAALPLVSEPVDGSRERPPSQSPSRPASALANASATASSSANGSGVDLEGQHHQHEQQQQRSSKVKPPKIQAPTTQDRIKAKVDAAPSQRYEEELSFLSDESECSSSISSRSLDHNDEAGFSVQMASLSLSRPHGQESRESRFGNGNRSRLLDSLDRAGKPLPPPPPPGPPPPDLGSLGRRGGESAAASNSRVAGGGDVNAGTNASVDNLVEGAKAYSVYPADLKCPLPQYPINQLTSPELEMALQTRHGPYFTWDIDLVLSYVKTKGLGDDVIRIFESLQIDGAILHTLDRDSIKRDLGIDNIRTR